MNKIAYFDIHDLDMARESDKRNFRQLIRILMLENVVSDIKTLSDRDYLIIDKPKMIKAPSFQEFLLNEKENQKPCKYTEEEPVSKIISPNIVYVDFSKKRRIS